MNQNLIEKKILEDKKNGLSDEEIGNKYGVNLKFIEKVIVKNLGVNISKPDIRKNINKKLSPDNFKLERNSVWSFKSRGNWATHNGNYRGNWSPYIPRNIILRYSKEKDLVLDYFCGAGTTAIECKLLNRNFIGIDINENAINLAKENLKFESLFSDANIELKVGDARNLNFIKDESIDLICAHPPYADIIHYTNDNKDDLSNLDINDFLNEIKKVALESYRVLKDKKYCAILIGDIRKNKYVVPLGFWTIQKYLEAGFKIKELIIKRQHNCKTTGFWYKNSIKYNFLLLAHEYLIVFEKNKEVKFENKNISYFENLEKYFPLNYNILDNINLETTTVWIFNKNNWLDYLISNLIKRYSKEYLIFNNLDNISSYKSSLIVYFVNKDYLKFLKLIEKLDKGNLLALVCEDVRVDNNLIFSQPLFIENDLRNKDNLRLKEIIIVVLEEDNTQNDSFLKNNYSQNENLNIIHKYILLYEVI